jgi:hypothetical protein
MTKAKFSLRFRIENESIIYEKIFVQIAIVLNDRIRANNTVLNGTTTK